jgi:hypothetical protein
MTMKKSILALAFIASMISQTATAQFKDIQLHYELGSFKAGDKTIKRDFFKTKFQILHTDSLGITYLNTEIDYNSKTKGMSFGQFTLLRSVKLPFAKIVQPALGHAAILGRNNFFFAGVMVPAKIGRVTVLPLFLYSYTKDAEKPDARVMAGVSTRLAKNRIAIFGFASTWTYDNNVQGEIKGKKVGWQLTPQIWFHVNRSFAVGSKIDLSKNLYSADGSCDFLPTTGVRWVL